MAFLRNTLLMIISIIGSCSILIPIIFFRIWYVLLIFETIDQRYLIQYDALFFFIFSIDIFLILSIFCNFLVGIMNLMNITLVKKIEKNIIEE